MKTLKIGDTAMVKMVNPIKTSIANDKVIPVIYTTIGLMLYTPMAGVHINAEECVFVDIPLQCLIQPTEK